MNLARPLVAAALVFLAIGVYVVTMLGMTVAYDHPAQAVAPAAPVAVELVNTEPRRIDAIPAVQPLTTPAQDADAAFLADLLGPDTDVSSEQAFALTEQARRIAYLLSNPTDLPPGAEVPTRESILETLTTPGSLPNGGALTLGEATKLVDCALGAYAA